MSRYSEPDLAICLSRRPQCAKRSLDLYPIPCPDASSRHEEDHCARDGQGVFFSPRSIRCVPLVFRVRVKPCVAVQIHGFWAGRSRQRRNRHRRLFVWQTNVISERARLAGFWSGKVGGARVCHMARRARLSLFSCPPEIRCQRLSHERRRVVCCCHSAQECGRWPTAHLATVVRLRIPLVLSHV